MPGLEGDGWTSAVQGRDKTPMDIAIGALQAANSQLEKTISELEQRLGPILCAPGPSTPNENSKSGDVALASAIAAQADRTHVSNTALRNLISRLTI